MRVMAARSAPHRIGPNSVSVVEHGLEIERRAADDLEHLGSGGLLLQRLAEIVVLTQLVEQPRVLDGDDGLGGEVRDQSICLSVNGRTSWR